jgi:hypothetical protein
MLTPEEAARNRRAIQEVKSRKKDSQQSLIGFDEVIDSNDGIVVVQSTPSEYYDMPPHTTDFELDDDRQLTIPAVRGNQTALPNILMKIAMTITEIENYTRNPSLSKISEHQLYSSDENVKAYLTGSLLTTTHLTLYRSLLRLCAKMPLNIPLIVPYADVFRDTGIGNDGDRKRRIQDLLRDLSRTNLRLLVLNPQTEETMEINVGFLRATFQVGEDSSRFEVTFDVKGAFMVGDKLAFQPWKSRLKLSNLGQNILDRLTYRRRDVEVVFDMDKLRQVCGYNSPIDKFKKAVEKVMDQMVDDLIVKSDWRIEGRGIKSRLYVTYIYRPSDEEKAMSIVSNVEINPAYSGRQTRRLV